MEKYTNVYDFKVFSTVGKGETVYVIDKKMRVIGIVNDLSVQEVTNILNNAEIEKDRYEFYKIEVSENG